MAARRVLVTGASRGIGAAIAKQAAASGFEVTVHYNRDVAAAQTVLDTIQDSGVSGELLQFDISDRDATAQAITAAIEEHGAFYAVVCNAGIASDGAFPALTGEQWDSVLRTNLDGFYNVLHPLVMPMIRLRKGGRIVTLSSVSGLVGNRGQVNYSAAKSGIIGATKALAMELAKRKITVNCVAPGVIATDMTDGVVPAEVKNAIPLGQFGTADDVAATVNFLLSDAAGYITRQVISVNGGMC
ncbi:MAG: 3-oxoacyl-ACP reductase FabG [Congregibacter sp.]